MPSTFEHRARPPHALRAALVLRLLTAVTVAGVLLLGMARLSRALVAPDLYLRALDEAHAYDRLYSEVAADPALARRIDADLPGAAAARPAAVATLRLLAPPERLRDAAEVAAAWWTAALRNEPTGTNALHRAADPASIADYLTRQIAEPAPDAPDQLRRSLDDLVAALGGRLPIAVPAVEGADADRLARVLGPAVGGRVSPERLASVTRLLRTATAPLTDLPWLGRTAEFLTRGPEPAIARIGDLRDVMQRVLHLLPLLGVALTLGGGVAGGVIARRARCGRAWATGTLAASAIAVATVAVLLVVVLPRLASPLLARALGTALPPAGASLLHDVLAATARDLAVTLAPLIVVPAVGATLLALGRTRWRPRIGWGMPSATMRQRASLIACVVVVLAAPAGAPMTPRACNGSAALCDRRVDDVFFPATHNSMSAASLRWLFPAQETAIPAQLEAGFRGFLLDTHTWDESRAPIEEVSRRLPDDQRAVLDTLLAPFDSWRPGTFLCHGYCGFGATSLVDGLRQINDFLDRHPREVILLFMEDYVSVEQTRAALDQSGLMARVYDGADTAWPTLGTLIANDRRVIVFSEHVVDGPSWYHSQQRLVRQSNMATATAPSCRLGARPPGTLGLLKHWVPTLPSDRANATALNTREAILRRVASCTSSGTAGGGGGMVIAVDFGSIGDAVGAARVLNERLPGRPAPAHGGIDGATAVQAEAVHRARRG